MATTWCTVQIDTQYRKFARVLLGFENLLIGGWKERAEVLLSQTLRASLLQEAVTALRCWLSSFWYHTCIYSHCHSSITSVIIRIYSCFIPVVLSLLFFCSLRKPLLLQSILQAIAVPLMDIQGSGFKPRLKMLLYIKHYLDPETQ